MRAPKAGRAAVAVGAAVALLATTRPLHATFIHDGVGIANPQRVVTFSEHYFDRYTVITDQFADLGVEFEPFIRYNTIRVSPNPYGFDYDNVSNYPLDPRYSSYSIKFTEPVTAAAFALEAAFEGTDWPATFNFTAFLEGQQVERDFAEFTTLERNRFGFRDITFDEISITQLTAANNSFGWVLDTLQIGDAGPVVPEPAAATVCAALAAGGLLAQRRRRENDGGLQ